MNENLKKSIAAAKQLLELCKKDPSVADELAKTQGTPKGVSHQKMKDCVKDVGKKGGAANKYAVCSASLQGKTMRKEELKECMKADDARFSKLRKDPPSEGTGLPKPDSPHETKRDLKAKPFNKEELRECMKSDDARLAKKHVGFDKLQHQIASKEGYSQDRAAKIAAAIGQKKYGKEGMAHKAAAARKDEPNPDKEADAKLGEKVEQDVEQHFKQNAAAERKEGHKLVAKASYEDQGSEKGVHTPFSNQSAGPGKIKGGVSIAGHANRGHWASGSPSGNRTKAHSEFRRILTQQKAMKKPNLP